MNLYLSKYARIHDTSWMTLKQMSEHIESYKDSITDQDGIDVEFPNIKFKE